jgi:hypothetical protein
MSRIAALTSDHEAANCDLIWCKLSCPEGSMGGFYVQAAGTEQLGQTPKSLIPTGIPPDSRFVFAEKRGFYPPWPGKKNRPGTEIARGPGGRGGRGISWSRSASAASTAHPPLRVGHGLRVARRRVRRPASARCPSRPHDRADVCRRRPGHTRMPSTAVHLRGRAPLTLGKLHARPARRPRVPSSLPPPSVQLRFTVSARQHRR